MGDQAEQNKGGEVVAKRRESTRVSICPFSVHMQQLCGENFFRAF